MNGKQVDPSKASLPQLTPAAEEALEGLRPLILPGKESEASVVLEAYFESHRGPLPAARELRSYDLVLPGAAERIVAMAEREQLHRHSLEGRIVTTETNLRGRGQIFALGALTLTLSVVALFGFLGAAGPGAWMGGTVIVGVVAAFLGQRYFQRTSNESDEPVIDAPSQNSNAKGGLRATQSKSGKKAGKRR